jgi:hypothetical protein
MNAVSLDMLTPSFNPPSFTKARIRECGGIQTPMHPALPSGRLGVLGVSPYLRILTTQSLVLDLYPCHGKIMIFKHTIQ